MPVTNDFDRYFLHLPPFSREENFDVFWNNALNELSRIPIDPVFKGKKTLEHYEVFDVAFKSAGKTVIKGELYYPANLKKPKVIISIHDYNIIAFPERKPPKTDFAFFFLRLRGHELLQKEPEAKPNAKSNAKREDTERIKLPGYMIENILEPEKYYLKGVYLDAYRSIDALRLFNRIDCSEIGIIGKGLGAAAALFAASLSKRVKALVLEAPSFAYLELSQNISQSDLTAEINSFIESNKSKKKTVKTNLTYFDAINHSDKITCPVLATVGLKDEISCPECVFALFNHLLCEKKIEVYPEEGNAAGGDKQYKKTLDWLMSTLCRLDTPRS